MPASDPESVNCRNILADRKIVSDDQIKLFCDILFLHPDRGENLTDEYGRQCYINRIRPLTAKLRFPLAKPHSVVRKLLLPEQSKYTYLCDIHSSLNADFVHQWFKFLALEVGARLEILRSSSREHVGDCAWDTTIKPLTRLHKIWLSPEQVKEAFGDFVETGFDPQYELVNVTQQLDHCEACILARIGSHINTVWALHTVVKSRITLESHAKHPSRLRLLRLINPWIQHWQDCYSTEAEVNRLKQKEGSIGMSEELYEVREEIRIEHHRLRRAQRKLLDPRYSGSQKYKQLVKDLDDKAIEDSIYDAENDIIDHYAALRATQRASAMILAGQIDTKSGNHASYPRYRAKSKASLVSSSANPRGQPSPYAPRAPADKAYLESRYSINTIHNNDRALLDSGVALDHLDTHQPGLHLTTHYSPIHPSEMARSGYAYPATGSHDTACTTWPVHWTGSRIELPPREPKGHGSRDTSRSKPLAKRDAKPSASAGPIGHQEDRGRHGLAIANATARSQSQTNRNKSGKYTSPVPSSVPSSVSSRHEPSDNLQPYVSAIEPDFYYSPQGRDRDRDSIYTDIQIIEDNPRSSRVSRASTVSAASGYSGYHKHNGGRGYAPQLSNLRFEARLSRPVDEPAAVWGENRHGSQSYE